MHIHKTTGKDSVICMKRDEFIHLVSECMKMLCEKDRCSGLPYLRDDVENTYLNFSVLDEKEYNETLMKINRIHQSCLIEPSPLMYRSMDFRENPCWACKKCGGLGICFCNRTISSGELICDCGWLESECKCPKEKK